MTGPERAVLLDRDGTIITATGYLGDPAGIRFLPGAVTALKRLAEGGYGLFIVTNQSGIGRGYFTEEAAMAVNLRIEELLREEGVPLEGIYYCPHRPDEGCRCRKPEGLMARRVLDDYGLRPEACWVVGDTSRDVAMGREIGMRAVLVMTGLVDKGQIPQSVTVAGDLEEAAVLILGSGR